MGRLLRRLGYLLRHRRCEAELADEIELHRALTQERLERSGLPAADAKYATRRALGNVTLARENARGVWIWPWLESVWQDAWYTARTARRNPGFAAAVVLVMCLGIGATTGVFGLLDALVLRDLPVRDPERLVWFKSPAFSYPVFTELGARGSQVFSGLFAWNMERLNVEWAGELEPAEVLTASGGFYSTLGVSAVLGRTFTDADDRIGGGPQGPVAVISHACWQRRFGGDASVVGRPIRIEGVPFVIIGVTPAGFFGVAAGLAPEIAIPLTSLQEPGALRSFSSAWLHLMGRVHEGLTLEQANSAVQALWPAVLEVTTNPGMPAARRARYLGRQTGLEPGRAGFSRVRNQFEEPLWLLLGLVGLLLIVACASAANLLLARGLARRREISVRLAIGASRGRLVRQMLTEAFVWTSLGAALGTLVASWAGGALVAMMVTVEEPIVLDVSPNWRVLAFTLALTLLTAGVCAVLPAFRVTRLDPGLTLKDTGQVGGGFRRRWTLGKALVTAQVALTVLLLVGAALFVRSLQRVLSQDAGFERNNVLVLSTEAMAAGYKDARLIDFYTQLLTRLQSIPGVESASLSQYPPISDDMGSWSQSIAVDGAPVEPDSGREVYFNAISAGYFDTVGMRLRQGRDFVRTDGPAGTKVVAVNESLARRFFPDQNPLGRRITMGRDRSRQDLEIVGIVGDAKYQRLQERTRAIAYLPCAQVPECLGGTNLFAEVRAGGRVAAIAEGVRREMRALDPRVPVRLETVTDRIRASLVKERVMAALASGLGLAALALACAGLYGLLAYTVSRQTSEIGLRLALGAERSTVQWMVLRDCLTLAGVGIVSGLAASLALGRFVRALLYQVSATDPAALAAAVAIMTGVAVCAGLLPARRAARVDPVVALRCE